MDHHRSFYEECHQEDVQRMQHVRHEDAKDDNERCKAYCGSHGIVAARRGLVYDPTLSPAMEWPSSPRQIPFEIMELAWRRKISKECYKHSNKINVFVKSFG